MLNILSIWPSFILLQLTILKEVYCTTNYYCEQATAVPIYVNSSQTVFLNTNKNADQAHYDNNVNCFWSVRTEVNKKLHFKVTLNDLQYAPEGANCNGYDHFVYKEENIQDYYDWSGAETGMYFSWCGDNYPPYFSSKDNGVELEFFTNDRNTYNERGIRIEINSFDLGSCPPGWTEETSRITDYCYKLSSYEASWVHAQAACNKEQANLVSLGNEEEANFITDLIENSTQIERREKVWIGLNDITTDTEYKWLDKSDVAISYRWREPHHIDEYDNCVSIRKDDGLWQDEFCTESDIQTTIQNKFICKTNKDGNTVIADLPDDRDGKSGTGSSPPIRAIILGIVLGGLVIGVCTAIIIYACKRHSTSHTNTSAPSENLTIGVRSHSVISTQGVHIETNRKQKSQYTDQEDPPPEYKDVVAV